MTKMDGKNPDTPGWAVADEIRHGLLREHSLRSGPTCDLPRRGRRELWLAFGAYERNADSPPFAIPTIGLRRRFDLHLGCLMKALPQWEARYPRSMVLDNVSLACACLRGAAAVSQLKDRAVDAWADFDDWMDEDAPAIAMLAGSAAKLLALVLYDVSVYPDPTSDMKGDLQFEFENRMIDFDVSRILAGTFTPRSEAEFQAIRVYWTWYLEEAVPKAWELGWTRGQ